MELNTYRTVISTDGRQSAVKFSDDLYEDASRRDFTFNSIDADLNGNVYDPFNGKKDLELGIVKFIGTPENRIKDVKDGFGYARQLTAILSSKNRIRKVKSIKAKTLLIHGNEDPVLKVENSKFMNKLIPNSNLIIISNMRHLIEEEILDQFKDKLKIHLSS